MWHRAAGGHGVVPDNSKTGLAFPGLPLVDPTRWRRCWTGFRAQPAWPCSPRRGRRRSASVAASLRGALGVHQGATYCPQAPPTSAFHVCVDPRDPKTLLCRSASAMNPIREPANASRMLALLLPGLRTSCMGSRGGAAPMPAG